jgi:hypothetical protein
MLFLSVLVAMPSYSALHNTNNGRNFHSTKKYLRWQGISRSVTLVPKLIFVLLPKITTNAQ